MAEEIKRVIEVETTSGSKSIRELLDEIDKLKKKLAELTEGTKEFTEAQARMSQAQEEVNQAMEITAKDEDAQVKSMQELRAIIDENTGSFSDLVARMQELKTGIDTANANVRQLKKDYQNGKISVDAYTQGLQENLEELQKLRTEQGNVRSSLNASTKALLAAEGSYTEMSQTLGQLRNAYRQLTKEQREGAFGTEMLNNIRRMDKELKAIDASMGNFYRNVGNYASAAKGFTPLNFQIQQVARELPSLTMSLQQFFLALSNNIPMLADELNRARDANKALRAEGKATIPVFKQVVSSIVSWQTGLVVGITLLTAYGKEIGNWVKSLFSAKEEAISMEQAIRNVNKALEEDGYGIGEQIVKVRELQKAWSDLGDDLDARKKFITDNKDAFDELGVKVTDVNDAENLLVRNTDAFIESMKARAIATAGQKLAAEAYEKALIEEEEALKKISYGYVKRYANEEQTTVRRPYTEEEIEEIMAPARALEAQAVAYIDLSIEKQKAAQETLDNAGIEEQANEGVAKSVRQLMTLEQIQYRMRLKNTDEYTKAISKQQQEWGKLASNMESDIEKELDWIEGIADAENEIRNKTLLMQAENKRGTEEGDVALIQERYRQELDAFNEMVKEKGISESTAEAYRVALAEKTEASITKTKKKYAEAQEKIDKLKMDTTLNVASSTLNSLSSILGTETAAGKAAAVASATIDTYKAANAAYASMAGIPIVGPGLGAAAAAAAIVAGIANVKNILSVDTSSGSGSGISSATPSVSTPTIVTPPAVVQEVATVRSLTGASEEERLNQMASDQRVYLVYSDVEQAGRRVQVQQSETSF